MVALPSFFAEHGANDAISRFSDITTLADKAASSFLFIIKNKRRL